MSRQLVHQPGFGLLAGESISRNVRCILLGILQNVIRKAKFNGLVRIHPGFGIHEVGQLGAGKAGLDLIGIHDALLDLVQHFYGFFHICLIPIGHRHGIVDHHQSGRGHQHPGTGHRNDRCSGCRNAIDLDGHIVLVIHQHGINLACRNAVTARGIEPHSHGAFACKQLIVKHLRRDIIVKPRSFCDGAVEFKNSLRPFVCLVLPFPEPFLCLHRNPPFL